MTKYIVNGRTTGCDPSLYFICYFLLKKNLMEHKLLRIIFMLNPGIHHYMVPVGGGRLGRDCDRVVVGFTTTYATNAYHY